jgi:hypothetical protein
MGGLVNTSIRFKSGEIINTLLYTSQLELLFASKSFYDKDEKEIKKLAKTMKNTTWTGKKYNQVSPYHYGLVIADLMTDTIIDFQGYCSIGKQVVPYHDFPELHETSEYILSDYYEDSPLQQVVSMFLEGRVSNYSYYDLTLNTQLIKSIDDSFNTIDDVVSYIHTLKENNVLFKIIYDTRCTIHKINDSDIISLLNKMREIDYPLTEKDTKGFDEFAKERNNDED